MEHASKVMTFVGIDAHSGHCSLKAIDKQGASLLEKQVLTRSHNLQHAVSGLPVPVWVMFESSCLAAQIQEWLFKKVDRVIVCETRENRWISHSEDKSDPADADRLARLLRLGEFKEVYVPRGVARDRREVVRLYQKLVSDVVRTKNRIKAKYREHGAYPLGDSVYDPVKREDWLRRLRRSHARFLVLALYSELDAQESVMERVQSRLFKLIRSTREYKLLVTIPGVGRVSGSIIACLIEDGSRFQKKSQLWKYSSLGIRKTWSSDPGRARVSASPSGNRMMKYAAMTAANAALRGDNEFSRHYRDMLSRGISPAMAKKTVARKILATALAMLKSGTPYRARVKQEDA